MAPLRIFLDRRVSTFFDHPRLFFFALTHSASHQRFFVGKRRASFVRLPSNSCCHVSMLLVVPVRGQTWRGTPVQKFLRKDCNECRTQFSTDLVLLLNNTHRAAIRVGARLHAITVKHASTQTHKHTIDQWRVRFEYSLELRWIPACGSMSET